MVRWLGVGGTTHPPYGRTWTIRKGVGYARLNLAYQLELLESSRGNWHISRYGRTWDTGQAQILPGALAQPLHVQSVPGLARALQVVAAQLYTHRSVCVHSAAVGSRPDRAVTRGAPWLWRSGRPAPSPSDPDRSSSGRSRGPLENAGSKGALARRRRAGPLAPKPLDPVSPYMMQGDATFYNTHNILHHSATAVPSVQPYT